MLPEQPDRIEKPAASPSPAAPVPLFWVREVASPRAVQEQRIVETPVEAYAAATGKISKRADLKVDIAALLASQSGLREAMMLREIFGPPRSLQGDIGL